MYVIQLNEKKPESVLTSDGSIVEIYKRKEVSFLDIKEVSEQNPT